MGAHGISALGEIEDAAHISYGIPEVLVVSGIAMPTKECW